MNIEKIIKNLGFWIFAAMLIGIFVGVLMGEKASMFAPLGSIFIQLIKMLVIPLVLISIISGSAALGATKSAGKIGIATLGYIFITTIISVILALIAGNLFKMGQGINISSIQNINIVNSASVNSPRLDFWDTLIGMIPANPIEAMVEGNILQIIVFGLFIGFGLASLHSDKKQPIIKGLNYVLEIFIWCINKVMFIAPLGVFGLMADATGTFGFEILTKILNLLWVNLLVVAFVGLILYPLTIILFSRTKISTFFKAMTKPQIVAFSTASSMATLPINMETCENKLGVSKEVSSFVIPLGATINMAGNAIYYTLVALFFSQLYGIELTMSHYVAITLTASLGSIGQAGVPGPTLLVVAVLASAGIPLDGLPLLYALDRVFDMIRTTLNITGDAACAVTVNSLNKK